MSLQHWCFDPTDYTSASAAGSEPKSLQAEADHHRYRRICSPSPSLAITTVTITPSSRTTAHHAFTPPSNPTHDRRAPVLRVGSGSDAEGPDSAGITRGSGQHAPGGRGNATKGILPREAALKMCLTVRKPAC